MQNSTCQGIDWKYYKDYYKDYHANYILYCIVEQKSRFGKFKNSDIRTLRVSIQQNSHITYKYK